MQIDEQINKLITIIDNQSLPVVDEGKRKQDVQSFLEVLQQNIKDGIVSYDFALKKVADFAKDEVEKIAISAQIKPDLVATKTASYKGGNSMSKAVENELEKMAAANLPHLARYMSEQAVKLGWHNGTGATLPAGEFDSGAAAADQKYIQESMKEGAKQMIRTDKEREIQLRAALKETADRVKKSWFLGTGDEVDSAQWDNKVIEEELARMKRENAEMEKNRKRDEKLKNDSVVRASDYATVKVAVDQKNPRQSKWVVASKTDGETFFEASVEDITAGNEIDNAALGDLLSPAYGSMILDSIEQNGLLATAKSMVGEKKFNALFKAAMDSYKADEDKKKEEDEKKKEEENKSSDMSGTEGKKTAAESELEKTLKNASSRVKFYTVKGILDDIKKDASAFKNATLEKALKKAEDMLIDMKGAVDSGSEIPSGDQEEVANYLQVIDEAIELLEANDIEGAKVKLEEAKGADMANDAMGSELPAAVPGLPEATDATETPGLPEATEDKAPAFPADKAAANSKVVKKAADEKQYDVTGQANFEKLFHPESAPKDAQLKEMTNAWEQKRALEGIAYVKPTGKLAAINALLRKEAKGADGKMQPEVARYVAEAISPEYSREYANVAGLTTEQVAKQTPKEASMNETIARTKRAMEAVDTMVTKQLLPNTKVAKDTQFERFMKMADTQMEAYVDSLEALEPSSEVEEGRYRVEALEAPEVSPKTGMVYITKSYVDNIPVCKLSAQEIGVKVGSQVTKNTLKKALAVTKWAMGQGHFDVVLSNGKVDANNGVDVNLNLNQTDDKDPFSLNNIISQLR